MNQNENRIRELAYQIWESEGKPHGQSARHWDIASRLAADDTDSISLQQAESAIPKARKASITSQGAAVSTQQQAETKPPAKPRKARSKTTPQMS